MFYDINSIIYVIRESCYFFNGLFILVLLKRCCFYDNYMYNNKKREKSLIFNSWFECVCVCWEGEVDICSFFMLFVLKFFIGLSFNNILGKNFIFI